MNNYTRHMLEKNLGKCMKAFDAYDKNDVNFRKEMALHTIVSACKDLLESADYKVITQEVDPDVKTKTKLLKYYYAYVQSVTSEPIVVNKHRDNMILDNLITDIGAMFLIDDEGAVIAKIKAIINKLMAMVKAGDCPFEKSQLASFNRVFYRNKEKDGLNFIINDIVLGLIEEQERAHESRLMEDSERLEEEYFANHNGGMFTLTELEAFELEELEAPEGAYTN